MTLHHILLLCCACGLLQADVPAGEPTGIASATTPVAKETDRSPISVAVSPTGRYCVSANHTAQSISLVDLKPGHVVAEHHIGGGPADVVWVDRKSILVSLLHDDAVAVVKFVEKDGQRQLTTDAVIPVGDEPRGIALGWSSPEKASDEKPDRAFVAVSGADQVVVLDLKLRQVVRRIPVGGLPRTLAVSPNGRWLVTCCNIPGELLVHDTSTYKLLSRRRIFDDAFNLGVPVILPDSSTCILPSAINRTFPVSLDNVEKGWVIDNRLSKLPLPSGKYWEQKQMGLDVRGSAAGDAHAVAISPDSKWLVVTCGGSHELLILNRNGIPWPPADPGDFIPVELRDKAGLLRRVELGGRPLGAKFIDNRTLVVANYLLNSLQVVDVVDAKLITTISLGGPDKPSLARRGEMIFYDADRSFDSWFSCQTCHTDGHTSGQTFDTLNDGNYDTYKLTPSLRGVAHTGPWTWHGWQKSLTAGARKSLRDTLGQGKPTTDDDVQALMTFLKSLKHPQSPHRRPDGTLTPAASRGKTLFEGKAACSTCHAGRYLTSKETYKVGLESKRYFFPEFNPPSLRGLHARRRFLHDGRADRLDVVLTRHHQPENLAGEALNQNELNDLIAYLQSL